MNKTTILITRPEPTASSMSAQLQREGFHIIIEPVLRVNYFPVILDWDKYSIIITTSGMAIRNLALLTSKRDFDLWCVGKTSQQLALSLGFKDVYLPLGQENAQALVESFSQKYPLSLAKNILYAAGDVTRLDIQSILKNQGYNIDKEILYGMISLEDFSQSTLDFLKYQNNGAITFYSLRTAEVFLNLYKKHFSTFKNQNHIALCFSEEIAKILYQKGWTKIITGWATQDLSSKLKQII